MYGASQANHMGLISTFTKCFTWLLIFLKVLVQCLFWSRRRPNVKKRSCRPF